LAGMTATTRAERMDCESPAGTTTGTANLSTPRGAVLRSSPRIFVMKRLGAIVIFTAAVLVSTKILAPAAPPPAAPAPRSFELLAIAQSKSVVDEVDAQVDRLREKLANPPAYPQPTRDPFRFGQRPESERPK